MECVAPPASTGDWTSREKSQRLFPPVAFDEALHTPASVITEFADTDIDVGLNEVDVRTSQFSQTVDTLMSSRCSEPYTGRQQNSSTFLPLRTAGGVQACEIRWIRNDSGSNGDGSNKGGQNRRLPGNTVVTPFSTTNVVVALEVEHATPSQASTRGAFVPYRMEKGDPLAPELGTTNNPYQSGARPSELGFIGSSFNDLPDSNDNRAVQKTARQQPAQAVLTPTLSPDYSEVPTITNGINFQGPMKWSRRRILWQVRYFTLQGTYLSMYKDAGHISQRLKYIDIKHYKIKSSDTVPTSKLNAAFRAVFISHNRRREPVGAYGFQLIPQNDIGARLEKDNSHIYQDLEGVDGTGKTYHFTVQSEDARCRWMRALMLSKTVKHKDEGFIISVNGNMI